VNKGRKHKKTRELFSTDDSLLRITDFAWSQWEFGLQEDQGFIEKLSGSWSSRGSLQERIVCTIKIERQSKSSVNQTFLKSKTREIIRNQRMDKPIIQNASGNKSWALEYSKAS
jgi:hypothetical protein